MTDVGLAARQDYRIALFTWSQKHPDADSIEQEEAIGRIGAGILGRLGKDDNGNQAYSREGLTRENPFPTQMPADAPASNAVPKPVPKPAVTNPFAGTTVRVPSGLPGAPDEAPAPTAQPSTVPAPTAPQAAPQPAPRTPAPAPAAPSAPPPATAAPAGQPAGEAQGWFNGLPPEFRGELERMAATEKKPLQMKVEELYRKGRAAGSIPAPVAAPIAPAPAPATPAAPGRQSSMMAPDGTPIETASTSAATNPREEIVQSFRQAAEGAYVGRATFDGTKATLNGQTFTGPASPEQVARRFEGLSEADPQHRAVLTDFLSKAAGQRIDPAKVPWCAAFVDAVLDASGKPKHGSLRAADFLDYGAATDKPTKGDVVVFRSMAKGSSGHVGFVVGIEGDRVRYIAGNDDNKVQEDTLPLAKVAGFRRPPEAGTGPFGADAGQAAGAFSRVLGTTGQPAGGYASPELTADPKAARILDLVTGAELNPANAGNYNAIFGNAGATEDLSKRTLDQTIAWSRDRGTTSSATGRYQFMADTMVGLKKEMGLSGTEAFTPELQDRMALRLLARRGYREWATGKLSNDDFANRLAQEWASLPNLQTGRSHYAGDGVNKALVSPAQVRSVLEGTGAFPAARLASVAKTLVAPVAGSRFLSRVRGMFGGGSASQETTSGPSLAPEPAPSTGRAAPLPAPVQASHERILAGLEPEVASVVRRAQADNPSLRLAAVSGRGGSVEVRAVGPDGRAIPAGDGDEVGAALQRAAGQLGVGVNWASGTRTLSSVKKTLKA